MSLGGAMLRVGGENLLQYFSSPAPSAVSAPLEVDRIGAAASEDTTLSEEEILHRLKVRSIPKHLKTPYSLSTDH